MKSRDGSVVMVAVAAGLLCLMVYLRALSCDFINWDDPLYITENPAIRLLDWQFIREALSTSYAGWWMPLTWISFAIDYHFWGLNPFGYHLTNVLLHAANTTLVVLIADCLLGQWAGVRGKTKYLYPATLMLAGLLWGIHPLRVESVAWVTERKDVLNGIFSLAAILCYLRYARMRDAAGFSGPAIRNYIFSLLFLLLSLMSKPVSVVIPAMLLVADWYPLGRLRKGKVLSVVMEKIPFFVLVSVISLATLQFAAGNQILVSYTDLTLFKRFVLAGNSLFEYCRLSFFPVGIIHLYLLPWPFPAAFVFKSTVIVVFCMICMINLKKRPWLPAVWVAFVLPLIPVLGFFQNGAQSHAARFTYLPAVIPSICVAALIGAAYGSVTTNRLRYVRLLIIASAGLFILFCTVMTERLIGSWKNPETLWTRVIRIQPVGRAYYLRADYYLQTGRYSAAADDLLISIKMGEQAGFPDVFNLHALRGDAFNKMGRYEEALREFSEAIRLYPYTNYYYHRALALNALGRVKEAQADFMRAGNETGPITWQTRK